jgi:hypothetical protein
MPTNHNHCHFLQTKRIDAYERSGGQYVKHLFNMIHLIFMFCLLLKHLLHYFFQYFSHCCLCQKIIMIIIDKHRESKLYFFFKFRKVAV